MTVVLLFYICVVIGIVITYIYIYMLLLLHIVQLSLVFYVCRRTRTRFVCSSDSDVSMRGLINHRDRFPPFSTVVSSQLTVLPK